MTMPEPVLEIDGLTKTYAAKRTPAELARRAPVQRLVAMSRVSLTLPAHGSVGVVGESGSGKSTLARSIVRLVTPDEGAIRFHGEDLLAFDAKRLADARRRLQMIYQDPYSSLNPRMRIRDAITEPALVHRFAQKDEVPALAAHLLDQVGLSTKLMSRRPRALSGGQRQRVAIARALAARPEVLIADEAVSALDVSIQAQILNLFADLRDELGLALIFISHQLSVIAHVADTVAIMYLGRVVESGPTEDVFAEAAHPYTQALLAAQPRVDRPGRRRRPATTGQAPSPFERPAGCAFRTRCPLAEEVCATIDPPLVQISPTRLAACHVLPTRLGFRHADNDAGDAVTRLRGAGLPARDD